MSKKYIDASKIGLTNFEIFLCNGDYKEALSLLLEKIENLPAEDVKEVRHGKWKDCGIIHNGDDEYHIYRCSECIIPNYRQSRYCPYCGAQMDEDE